MPKLYSTLAALVIVMPPAVFTIAATRPKYVPRVPGAVVLQHSLAQSSERYLVRIRELKLAKNLDGLTLLADEIEAKSSQLSIEEYSTLVIELVGALSGYDLNDDRRYGFAIKYAKLALEKGDRLPIGAEVRLARFLEGGPEYHTGNADMGNWAADRRERTKYWLHAWRRLNAAIDRDFDFNDRPRLKVMPPPGFGPAGISPQSIKDLKARAIYERAIAENNKKLAEYREQWELRQLDRYFTRAVKRFLIEAYSRPPHDFSELCTYLNAFGIDAITTESILRQTSPGSAVKCQ